MTTVTKKNFETQVEEREVLVCNNCMADADDLPEEERIVKAFDGVHLCSRCAVDLHDECQDIDEIEIEDTDSGVKIEAKTVNRPIMSLPDLDIDPMNIKISAGIVVLLPLSIFIALFVLTDGTEDRETRYTAWLVLVHLIGAVVWSPVLLKVYFLL